MRVDLLLILCLHDEYDLHGYKVVRVFTMWKNELRRSVDRNLSSILPYKSIRERYSIGKYKNYLKDMRNGVLAIDLVLHHTILIHTNGC